MYRNLGWMVSTVKSILVAYQKKTDYKPEGIAVAEGSQVQYSTLFALVLLPVKHSVSCYYI